MNLERAEILDDDDSKQDDVCEVWSATNDQGTVIPLRIECAMGRGFSGICMIGNVGQICDDGKERAKAALERLGWASPARKTIISVSPGDAKIDRTHLDLALSVVLAGVSRKSQWLINVREWLFAAEIGLNGELREIPGVVAWASLAMELRLKGIVVAKGNLRELSCLSSLEKGLGGDFRCIGLSALSDVLNWLETGVAKEFSDATQSACSSFGDSISMLSFDDMDLCNDLRLLAGVVAAGGHSLLMRGSPGTGKSMFAKRLPSILPPMTVDQHLRSLRIYSASMAKVPEPVIRGQPPFRSPHHHTSQAAIVGTSEKPGELSLASGGVLFLDELPEFRRDVLEGLREPLESGEILVSRALGRSTWIADVILIAAANNCPCGWSASRRRRCECPPSRLNAYRNRLSGPLQDRIDLHVNMPEPGNQVASLLAGPVLRQGQTFRLKEQVAAARKLALGRQELTGVVINKDIPVSKIFSALMLPSDKAESLLTKVIPGNAGARAIVRCLRVARTIADLMGRQAVEPEHLARAWNWQAQSSAKLRGEVGPLS